METAGMDSIHYILMSMSVKVSSTIYTRAVSIPNVCWLQDSPPGALGSKITFISIQEGGGNNLSFYLILKEKVGEGVGKYI